MTRKEYKLKFTPNEVFYVRKLLQEVKLKDVIAPKVIAINVDEPFSHVEEKMREFCIRHLPIVDKDNKLVGIITQRDLYRIQSPHKDEDGNWFYDKELLDTHILKYVMTPDPFTLSFDNHLSDALLHMVDRKYGCIPIVDEGKMLLGVITQIDILNIAAQILRE